MLLAHVRLSGRPEGMRPVSSLSRSRFSAVRGPASAFSWRALPRRGRGDGWLGHGDRSPGRWAASWTAEGRGRATRQAARPGNYIDLTDDGKAMGIVPLDKLPVTREAYDTQLGAGGVDDRTRRSHRGAEQFEVEPRAPSLVLLGYRCWVAHLQHRLH